MARNGNDPVQQYRGTTEQHQTYTGPLGEITVDTTKKTAVVQDGVTSGGHPLMREDAPDELTIMRTDDGHIQGMDVAIHGDVSDLASMRGQLGDAVDKGAHDFATPLSDQPGHYTAAASGSTNAPFDGPFHEQIVGSKTKRGSILLTAGRSGKPRMAISSTLVDPNDPANDVFSGYNRVITEDQIGEGMRVTDDVLFVPDYEGATATEPGTAGLVPAALPEERDYVLYGDGTWRENIFANMGKLAHAEVNTYNRSDVVVTANNFDPGELYYGDDISTTRVFTQKVDDGIKILEDGVYEILLEIGVNNTTVIGDLLFGTRLVARESGKLPSPINMSTNSVHINDLAAYQDAGSVTVTKSLKAGDVITPYLGILGGEVFNLHWVTVVLTKFPSVSANSGGSTDDVAVDNITITKKDKVLSVLPEGLADNKSIFVNKEGKLESKSIPFDGGSIFDIVSEKYGSDFPSIIFEVPASGAFIIPELTSPFMAYNFYDKEIFGHVENDRFVFDTEGFYIVSVKWKGIPINTRVSFDSILQIIQLDENDNVSVLGEDDLRIDQHVELSAVTTLTCTAWAKPGQGIQSRLFIPGSNTVGDIVTIAWHIRITKLPNTNEYQVQNAHYCGCYQRDYVLGYPQLVSDNPTRRVIDIDWNMGNTLIETPESLSIVENHGVMLNRPGLTLFFFAMSIGVADGTGMWDFVCQAFRRNAAGQDTVIRGTTFRVYEGVVNPDEYTLTILVPMQEGDAIWFRLVLPEMFQSISYRVGLSGTVLPSVASSTGVPNIDIFTPPTASAPGKAGLVPGPGAMLDIDRLFGFLAADGWAKFGVASIGPDPSVANSRELVLGAQAVGDINADTLASGCYISSSWAGTPSSDGTVISLPLFARGNEYYGVIQFKLAYGGICAYRTTKTDSLLRVGTKPTSDNWAPWISINAPTPRAAEGVGQWKNIYNNSAGNAIALPSDGVWSYFLLGVNSVGDIIGHTASTAAGGAMITMDNTVVNIYGFAWRVA